MDHDLWHLQKSGFSLLDWDVDIQQQAVTFTDPKVGVRVV